MRLSRRRGGLSALFDAFLFFLLVSAAGAALYYSASSASTAASEDVATRHLDEQAADVMACALESTIGPVNYSSDGTARTFYGTVLEGIEVALRVQAFCASFDTGGLLGAVRGAYALLVERPLHFAVVAGVSGWNGTLFFSDTAAGPGEIGKVRWTSSVPLIMDGGAGELTLFLWR